MTIEGAIIVVMLIFSHFHQALDIQKLELQQEIKETLREKEGKRTPSAILNNIPHQNIKTNI
tara:strand:- start:20 stop:205 length:186 start_codon:yes stop_codon:yes gene_type:complete